MNLSLKMIKYIIKNLVGEKHAAFLRHVFEDFKRFYLSDFITQRDLLATAPYSTILYKEILTRLRNDPNVIVLSMKEHLEGKSLRNKVNMILRHDMDTALCAENLSLLTDIEKNEGFRSTIYVRVDEEEYGLTPYISFLKELCNNGFEIGLHTAAYLQKDPIAAIKTEIEKFKMFFGFFPQTFTTHGIIPITEKVRKDFIRNVALSNLGFLGSDDVTGYNLRTGDSNKDSKRSIVYLKREVLYLNQCPLGWRVLLLTHPCYWKRDEG